MTLQHTRRIVKSLFILFIIVVCIYLLPRVAINAFYYPDNKVYGPPPAEAESITFTAKDGTHLHGWFIPTAFGRPENAVATVIHVHGNAGNMSAHWPLVSWLPERNVNLFMFDYRGFGESEGTPSQEGLQDDTKSAIDYESGSDGRRTHLLGRRRIRRADASQTRRALINHAMAAARPQAAAR